MCKELTYAIVAQKEIGDSKLYSLDAKNIYIISNPDTRKLLCEPEIIGYSIPCLLQQPIADALQYFCKQELLSNINVVYILRGGLNFPVEAACSQIGLNIGGVSFLTSERIFQANTVSRIESTYRKINTFADASVVIGDIIASGDTLRNAVRYIEEQYFSKGKTIRNIILFTIGTSNTLKVLDALNCSLRHRWPGFEGIWAVFFEGIFNAYPDVGITGLNLPGVDFFLNGALLAPEYRLEIISRNYSIFEKCVIYDGGARRFEQSDHVDCIVSYWKSLYSMADTISIADLIEEKYGYCVISFEEWRKINRYQYMDRNVLYMVYKREQSVILDIIQCSLSQISELRLSMLRGIFSLPN